MSKTIVIAGATGNLGFKISKELLKKGAVVIALLRAESDKQRLSGLEKQGLRIQVVDMLDQAAVSRSCVGADCVVSALAGLAEVIIDTQKILVDAAVEAKVPFFIPSDYSVDFTNLVPGQNRNLDLRRSFHGYLDKQPIKASSVFNGAFMDLLTGEMPLILDKFNRILYWGDPTVKMDFTSTDDVAAYTANLAMDDNAPRSLRIAGDSVSAQDVQQIMSSLTGKTYKLFRPGGINRLNSIIGIAKFMSGKSTELYPAWQGMQYMRDMMEGRAIITKHDNQRYPGIHWMNVREYLLRNGKGKS